MDKSLQLTQSLNALILHDLTGSTVIINNCLPLLETKNKTIRQKAKVLLDEEFSHLIGKIKLFRECYGSSGAESRMSIGYLKGILKNFFASKYIKPKLHFDSGLIDLNSVFAKASICLIQIISKNLSLHDTIDVFFGNNKGNNFIKIVAVSENLKHLKKNKEKFLILSDSISEDIIVNIHNCHDHYFNILCKQIGYKILLKKGKNFLEYKLVKK